MKLSAREKDLLQDVLLFAFLISFASLFLYYPQLTKISPSDVLQGNVSISATFVVKVIATLIGQTSVLGAVFYSIAKRMFKT